MLQIDQIDIGESPYKVDHGGEVTRDAVVSSSEGE